MLVSWDLSIETNNWHLMSTLSCTRTNLKALYSFHSSFSYWTFTHSCYSTIVYMVFLCQVYFSFHPFYGIPFLLLLSTPILFSHWLHRTISFFFPFFREKRQLSLLFLHVMNSILCFASILFAQQTHCNRHFTPTTHTHLWYTAVVESININIFLEINK